ncbi:hypothetical protein [Rhizobium sp. YS-1r]|uniref:hypothetical protein n=1 Tax=Rhizobium sp. YS-1r TaxID=1532558 RepID=UPI000A88B5EC|nr:hypothetical protein [Rhizobium sp. YS-1r]
MFNANRVMSDYIVDLADLSAYGCDPMTFEDLREEFEVFLLLGERLDQLPEI